MPQPTPLLEDRRIGGRAGTDSSSHLLDFFFIFSFGLSWESFSIILYPQECFSSTQYERYLH